MKSLPLSRGLMVALLLPLAAIAYEPAGFVPSDPPQVASDGVFDTQKARILRLPDGTLVAVYGQAQDVGQEIYDLDSNALRHPMDVVLQYSTDDGESWTAPINIDGTAAQSSQLGIIQPGDPPPVFPPEHENAGSLDLASDLRAIAYPGDSGTPWAVNVGNHLVVAWDSTYCPPDETRWPGEAQRFVSYPTYGWVTIPYSCVWTSRLQWSSGSQVFNPIGALGEVAITEQLTNGQRHAAAISAAFQKPGFALAWQEDPLGGQLSESSAHAIAEASTTGGSDAWYSALNTHNDSSDRFGQCLVCHGTERATAWLEPVRITSNVKELRLLDEAEVLKATHGPGLYEHGEPGVSRVQLKLAGSQAVVAWEESKSEIHEDGKYARYHTWTDFKKVSELGVHGCVISDPRENARKLHVITQGPSAGATNIVFLFRQGALTHGGAADVVMRRAVDGFDPASLLPAIDVERCRGHVNNTDEDTEGPDEDLDDPRTDLRLDDLHLAAVNLSGTSGPGELPGTALDAATGDNDAEDGKAHRGVLRGDTLLVNFAHVPDLAAFSQFSDAEPYNSYLLRSADGGATFGAVLDLSRLTGRDGVTAFEPRLVPTSGNGPGCTSMSNPADPADCQDPQVFYAGFGTQPNGSGERTPPLDLYMSISTDGGRSFSKPQAISAGDVLFGTGDDVVDREIQLKTRPDGAEAYIVWDFNPGETHDVAYLRLRRDLVLGSSFEDD